MKQFTLTYVDPNNDCAFLNSTPIEFGFADSNKDSGWCDMFTGARILSTKDSIVFDADEQDEAILKFKFGDRLVELQADW